MANNFNISNVVAIAMANAFETDLEKGTAAAEIDIRGTPQAADPDTAAGGTLLATLTCSDPIVSGGPNGATDGAPGGLLTLDTITDDSSADATEAAVWFRMRSVTTTPDDCADGECGTSGSDLNFNTTAITSGSTVSITSFTVTMPEG